METSENTVLTVYGKPGCVQCTATERYLSTRKIPFTKIDVTQSEEGFNRIVGLGYQQVPVVETATGDHWYGFVPDRLAEYS